ncbi:MAG: hypothetical protein RLZZ628_3695 [Bacteroidota bacterium]|jgi:hypothetical protein
MKNKIIDYLKNELSVSERDAFEKALATDADLQKAFVFQKAQWEKLTLLRLNAKAAAFLAEAKVLDMPKSAAIITLRRVQWTALAAATLLFVFNYNALKNWMKPSISTETSPVIAHQESSMPSPQTPMVKTPTLPETPVLTQTPHLVIIPPQVQTSTPKISKKKSKIVPPSPSAPVATTEIRQETLIKVGATTPNDTLFQQNPRRDTTTSKDLAMVTLDNMYDFEGDNSLISKHLSTISCNAFTVSFVIKTDGTVAEPKWEQGDKNCETAVLNQIKKMPLLKKPIYEGKIIDYRFTFIKKP